MGKAGQEAERLSSPHSVLLPISFSSQVSDGQGGQLCYSKEVPPHGNMKQREKRETENPNTENPKHREPKTPE